MIGWRAWRVMRLSGCDERVLTSVSAEYEWTPGLNVGCCLARYDGDQAVPGHAVPGPECTCGFWFFEHWQELVDYFGGVEMPMHFVFGKVETYGRHVEQAVGIRCEKASILALGSGAQNIASRYDVPTIDLPPWKISTKCQLCDPSLAPSPLRLHSDHYNIYDPQPSPLVFKDGQRISDVYEVDVRAGVALRYRRPFAQCNCRRGRTGGIVAYIDHGNFSVKPR